MDFKTLELTHLEEILEFELKKLAEAEPDPVEREFQSWHSKWRRESLQHYLPLGWSFVCRGDSNDLLGYFLAQPLLFFDGQTQALWVEHLHFQSLAIRDELCQLAYKLGREKHFQRVYFPANSSILNALTPYKPEPWGNGFVFVRTTRT